MRKHFSHLTLQEKVEALQKAPSSQIGKVKSHQSEPRPIKAKPSWGKISSADEKLLYSEPDIVPLNLRQHIKSLVWLARKEPEYIRKVLAKFDARSLAEAWIGPEDVLKALESQLPEKKQKLLQTYRSKSAPSAESEVFQQLVIEGLKDEAA